MQVMAVNTEKGPITVFERLPQPLRTAGEFMELLMNAPSETAALKAADLDDRFFLARARRGS